MARRSPASLAFRGQVVVLVNATSASASEVTARVVQLERRGAVIGDRTAGAVMLARQRGYTQGHRYRFLFYGLSITEADLVMSDGQSLEKVGVVPDEQVLPTAEDMAAGRDPVLALAAQRLGVTIDAAAAGSSSPAGPGNPAGRVAAGYNRKEWETCCGRPGSWRWWWRRPSPTSTSPRTRATPSRRGARPPASACRRSRAGRWTSPRGGARSSCSTSGRPGARRAWRRCPRSSGCTALWLPRALSVVTVSTDEDEAELRRFVAERSLTLPVLKDPGGRVAAGQYRTTGYPETFVLDRNGRVLQHVVGPAEWDSAERLAYFRGVLEGVPAR